MIRELLIELHGLLYGAFLFFYFFLPPLFEHGFVYVEIAIDVFYYDMLEHGLRTEVWLMAIHFLQDAAHVVCRLAGIEKGEGIPQGMEWEWVDANHFYYAEGCASECDLGFGIYFPAFIGKADGAEYILEEFAIPVLGEWECEHGYSICDKMIDTIMIIVSLMMSATKCEIRGAG